MHRLRRVLAALLGAVLFAATVLVAALYGLNVFLNVGLPILLNRQPERLLVSWDHAWTWDARTVRVEGVALRVQGPLDQWWLAVDRGVLTVDTFALLERRFQAEDVLADGVVLHYRRRSDAPTVPGQRPPGETIDGRTAPIPGLENPPLEPPEALYPRPEAPWLIALEGVEVDGLRELWLGDYRFVGEARLAGEVIVLPGSSIDLSGMSAEVFEGEILVEGIPVVSQLSLEAEGALEGVDPVVDAGAGMLRRLDAVLQLGGHVDDLRYVDIFLRDAPWVGIEGGSGRLDARFEIDDGVLGTASYAKAEVEDLSVRVGTYVATGDGRVNITLDGQAHMALRLDRFSVHQGIGRPLVRGRGFRLDAYTQALRFDEAPSGFTAIATLPRSEVPDLRSFDWYLPSDIGLRITGGHAFVEGRARIEEDGNTVSGALTVDMPEARFAYTNIPIAGVVRVTGNVVSGRLDDGRYDIRGSAIAVHHVSVGGKNPDWSARLNVREGRIATEARTFLTTRADFRCSDSSPFLRIAVGNRKIAPWVDDLVKLRNLEGEVRASIGETSLAIDHLHIRAPKAELHLHLKQDGTATDALLFARLGLFGAATELVGDTYNVQLLDAKRWFYARLAERGTPERMTSNRGEVTEAGDTAPDARRGLKVFGKDLRKTFEKKDPAEKAAKERERKERQAERKRRADERRSASREVGPVE